MTHLSAMTIHSRNKARPSIWAIYRNRPATTPSPLWDFGARLDPTAEKPALLVGHAAHVREGHGALHCHARFDPPGVLFHLQAGVEHDSLRGDREGVVGRVLRVTFDAAAVHHRACFGVANGPLLPRGLA